MMAESSAEAKEHKLVLREKFVQIYETFFKVRGGGRGSES